MRIKNTTSDMLCGYIIEAMFLLLKEKPFEEIRICEIAKLAGVNRSTFYRHFHSRQDIARLFYQRLLESCFAEAHEKNPDNEEYLCLIFRIFKKEKERLLLLDRNNLSFLLLEIMNAYFFARKNNSPVRSEIHFYYHVGGIFNAFLWWLHEDMKTSPEILARVALAALPADFKPLLL
ncbi:MAG: TetR/AcrR family transcriptional regulator [Lachnospiraceae bacterium]|nr:TetR/AcrR family transcriptional regulator [Lachnospiraceae bacterium]